MQDMIRAEGLGKRYLLRHRKVDQFPTLRDAIAARVASLNPFSARQHSLPPEEFWALRDLSLRIGEGERVGIIGRNGAGKSTLLKILSRITEPTTGQVSIRGRVATLLEVGTGFHPELTGRENIFLNGSILGMSRGEIRRKFDEIVAFAEVEKFLDTPVKRYSSGMYVRLAFAVAANLEPEILIVDEVLAVGDTQFQKKCLQKMEESGKQGRTVLFVSHNLGAVHKLCTRGILISGGKLVCDADVQTAVSEYLALGKDRDAMADDLFLGTLKGVISFHEIRVNGVDAGKNLVSPRSPITLTVTGYCSEDIPDFRTTFSVFQDDLRLLTQHDVLAPELLPKGRFEAEITIPPFTLRPGDYSIAIGGYRDGMADWIWGTYLKYMTVMEEWGAEYDPINKGIFNIPFAGQRRC